MKACVTTGEKRRMDCEQVPKPSIEPGLLLLKTRYACICGSDLEYLDGSLGDGTISPGAVLGHEFVAEVIEVGEGVTGWEIGDRATPGMGHGTGKLPGRGLAGGYAAIGGAMAEYMLKSPYSLQKVPTHVSDEEAALVEPLGTSVASVLGAVLGLGRSGVLLGKSVVIIGAGRIGLLAMMTAKVAGAAPVIGIDLVQSRLDKALELGADAVVNAGEVDTVSEVMKLTGSGANASILCIRDGKVLNQAVDMSSRDAVIVVTGVVPPTEVTMAKWQGKRTRLITVLGAPGGEDSLGLAMYLIAHKQVDPRPLISDVMPLENIQQALDTQYNGENIAVLLKP